LEQLDWHNSSFISSLLPPNMLDAFLDDASLPPIFSALSLC